VHKNNTPFSGSWAVILGGSSGFGLAAAKKLASHGMNIALLYREPSINEKPLKQQLANIAQETGVTIVPFNVNALDETARENFIDSFTEIAGGGKCVKLLLHSIARGNLKPLWADGTPDNELTTDDIRFTTYAMATSMLDWARALIKSRLFEVDGRIIGLTSEGAHKHWDGYAAVSIAKASLESLASYMAVEFGSLGLKTNLIQAGITETPSLKKIPGSEKLLQIAAERNPLGRATQPEDVADVIYLLCTKEAAWINGAIIHADGGEHCR
jgi:enoyl-[acyl-carrier protein] reductase III